MSLRRKSCEACFRGRRKCDLEHPDCGRCKRNRKACTYTNRQEKPPASDSEKLSSSINDSTIEADIIEWNASSLESSELQGRSSNRDFSFFLDENVSMADLLSPSIPDFLGPLGQVQPVSGNTKSWQWVLERLRGCPQDFAQNAETIFIHKAMYGGSFPKPLRAAFGVAAACTCTKDSNRSILFRSLDAELAELIQLSPAETILAHLVKLQAIVLYQIIRLLYGGIKERVVAEQQESLVARLALRLLEKTDIELNRKELTWENWILAESVRRTVMIAFLLYAVYSLCRHGVCTAYPTLRILPVSTDSTSWTSRDAQLEHQGPAKTVNYGSYVLLWLESPLRALDLYEKIILVACKGIDHVESLSYSVPVA
jgi:hypothetical protein